MKKIIYCPEKLPRKENIWVFLMGPIQGAPQWQQEVFDKFPSDLPVTFLNPRRKENPKGNEDEKKVFSDDDYRKQVEWETIGLRTCDIILCWIPSPAEDIPGRQYAQTTRFELGENLARGKKVLLGTDPNIPGYRYFQHKLVTYHQCSLSHSLSDLLLALENQIKSVSDPEKYYDWFTSDTHFGSSRALSLSRRPFLTTKDMDWAMIENWNKKVKPGDNIYHLGDFGSTEYLKYLNGNKILILGNYEREELKNLNIDPNLDEAVIPFFKEKGWDDVYPGRYVDLMPPRRMLPPELPEINLTLSHEPLKVKEIVQLYQGMGDSNCFGCFGHIHGRQMIKQWGIDVGVDAHNFTPIGLDEVLFYFNAIKTGKYDSNVWC